jgi:acetolactate synthase-1/2/3 large subunit
VLWSKRSCVLLGAGAREADLSVVMNLGVPVLTSWQAKDSVDNYHPNYFGSPGIYGQRAANKVLHNSDLILSIGNRLSIWNVGYQGIRKDQKLIQVEIDEAEIKENAEAKIQDARQFIEELREERPSCRDWLVRCAFWREDYPWLEKAHEDTQYINSYRFVARLQDFFLPDEVIVTEMGAALCSAHQILKLKPPQRLMTSGGLGEMGCGLPASVGAAFAHKGRVLCLSTDGGMMMNLQELQTIVHHQLPIKIIVFNNSGYGMLRETQRKGGMRLSGVDGESGVSFPNFRHVALAFGITASEIRTWEDFERIIPSFLSCEDPCLVDYVMDPRQPLIPKLDPIYVDGKPTGGPFETMSPILPIL